MFSLLAQRKEIVLRRLIENVVDHLNDIHEAGLDGFDSVLRFPAVEAEAEPPNPIASLQLFNGVAKIGIGGPTVIPDVKLQDVDFVDAKLFANQARVLEDVLGGKNLGYLDWGLAGHWPFIGGIFEAA